MKRFSMIVFGTVLIAALASCSGQCRKGAQSPSATGDAAIVGGIPITMAELDKAASAQLQKVDTQIYQIKKRILDDLVEERLIEAAAKKTGKSVDEYLSEEIEAKVTKPSEDEIKALYDARKGSIKQPYEEVKGQIVGYLTQNRKGKARQDLIDKLKAENKVEIILEPPRVDIDVGDAYAMGEKGSKITIVEFSDYQCPFCKRVRPTIWQLLDEYKGKIRYVFMDFPLSFHRESKKAHEAARCSGDQGKYYEYNRKLFDNQGDLGVDALKKYAKELKLDTKKFDECLDTGKNVKIVEDYMAKGVDAGVSGTPAYFINGIMISGAQPPAAFKEIIDSELNR